MGKLIIIEGTDCSGKGTQSENIIAKYGFKHFSTGDILRKQIADQTELGKVAKQFIDEGKLVAVGTHPELYQNCPSYQKMVDLQKLEEEEGGNQ